MTAPTSSVWAVSKTVRAMSKVWARMLIAGTVNPWTSPRARAMYRSCMLADRAPRAWAHSQTSHCAASAVAGSVVKAAVQARSRMPSARRRATSSISIPVACGWTIPVRRDRSSETEPATSGMPRWYRRRPRDSPARRSPAVGGGRRPSVRAIGARSPAMAAAIADLVAGDEPAHLIEAGDAGPGEAGEVVPTVVEIGLEVAGPAPEARGDLRQHAPGEVLVLAERAVPRREDGRVQALRVAVRVTGERPDVVRGEHPKTAAGRLGAGRSSRHGRWAGRPDRPEHEDAAEERQLVRSERQRAAPEGLEHVLEPSAGDDPARPLASHDPASAGRAERLRQAVDGGIRPHRGEHPAEQLRRGAETVRRGRDDERHRARDQRPDQRAELGVERPPGDELHERWRLGRRRDVQSAVHAAEPIVAGNRRAGRIAPAGSDRKSKVSRARDSASRRAARERRGRRPAARSR